MGLKGTDAVFTSQEEATDCFEYKGLCSVAAGQLLEPIFLVFDLHARPSSS